MPRSIHPSNLPTPLQAVGPGENPRGFVAQTCNETVRDGNALIDGQYAYDLQSEPRWNAPLPEPVLAGPPAPRSPSRIGVKKRRG